MLSIWIGNKHYSFLLFLSKKPVELDDINKMKLY